MSLQDRARGALLGLAAGDAVGAPNEFKTDPVPLSGMTAGGPFGLKAGQWTDDTSMALCLADSLIACNGFDAEDQMRRYVRWWREGYNSVTGQCFDIGNTTANALKRFEETGEPYAGSNAPHTAGNGSLMRLAPVVLFFWRDQQGAVEAAEHSSRTTHAAPQAITCCRDFARRLYKALHGASKRQVLDGFVERPVVPSGYVVESLNAALVCFSSTRDFQAGCLKAANLGGDSDTIAAIFGQLAGAFYGETGIPPEWIELLSWADTIRDKAELLLRLDAPA